jgi:hypothetical protein
VAARRSDREVSLRHIAKVLLVAALAGFPAGAQALFGAPGGVCFSSETTTYRVVTDAPQPDYSVRIAGANEAADLRVQVIDQAELADFVLVDDPDDAEATNCANAPHGIKTLAVSPTAPAPDLTISMASPSAQADTAKYRIFVRSEKFTPAQAAALFAVLVKTAPRAFAGK